MKNLKKSEAKWNKGNGAFKAKHYQTNQASCGRTREMPGGFPYPKMQQVKVYANKIQGVGPVQAPVGIRIWQFWSVPALSRIQELSDCEIFIHGYEKYQRP